MDDADDDCCQQNQNRKAAEQTQLFADGREDHIVVPFGKGATLHHAAVVKPLPGDAAVLQGANASVHLIADALCIGVDCLVKNDEDTIALVLSHAAPEKRRSNGDCAEAGKKPHEVHAADICHDDEDEDIAQRDAEVVGHQNNLASQQQRNTGNFENRQGRGNLVFLDADDLCQNQNIEDFADFRRLNIERQKREIQPALIAAAVDAPDFQHADEQHAKDQQQLAPLGDNIDVNERQNHIDCDTENQSQRLRAHIAGAAAIVGGAGDHDNAEDRRRDAQREQNHIRFSDKFPDGAENFTQLRHLHSKRAG